MLQETKKTYELTGAEEKPVKKLSFSHESENEEDQARLEAEYKKQMEDFDYLMGEPYYRELVESALKFYGNKLLKRSKKAYKNCDDFTCVFFKDKYKDLRNIANAFSMTFSSPDDEL